jgi:hypothetical protein
MCGKTLPIVIPIVIIIAQLVLNRLLSRSLSKDEVFKLCIIICSFVWLE